MASPIHLRLQGHEGTLAPRPFIRAVQLFWGLLRDLDAAISRDARGSVSWDIESLSKSSPAVIAFRGQPLLTDTDHTSSIQADCVRGLRLLPAGDRLRTYSDAAVTKALELAKLQRARGRDRLNIIEVFTDGDEVTLGIDTIQGIESLRETRYESVGSIVGSLDMITVHRGSEFRVWEEVEDRAVRCMFPDNMLEQVKDILGMRVMVYGELKANYKGQTTSVQVQGFERYTDEKDLPAIEEVSGLVEDFTDGETLKDYLDDIRSA